MSSKVNVVSLFGKQIHTVSASAPVVLVKNIVKNDDESVTKKSDGIVGLFDYYCDADREKEQKSVSVDENGSCISQEDMYQVRQMLTALATATDDHEDIIELLRSIKDQLRLAANKKNKLILCVDENGSCISQEDLYKVREKLTALATATDDHEDIIELLRSIQDQLRLAANKKKELILCVKSYKHFLKLKYNK
jgi:hypothetical protein